MGLKVKESEGYCGTIMAGEKVSLPSPPLAFVCLDRV